MSGYTNTEQITGLTKRLKRDWVPRSRPFSRSRSAARDSASSEPTCRGYRLLNEDESLTEGYT
jgi:hypothetical protein